MATPQRDELPVAGLTTGQLARLLGVSPTTLRSWDRRYGFGPASRADGRHRRWSPDDVAMAREMCRLTASGTPPAEAARTARLRARGSAGPDGPDEWPPVLSDRADGADGADGAAPRAGSGLPLGRVRSECRGLARAAVRLDAEEVRELLRRAVAHHGPAVAWEEVMSPALQAVGRKWQSSGERGEQGEQYVEVEHLLSWHISAALRHYYLDAARPRRTVTGAPVLLSCLPGEQHTLPLDVLTAVLGDEGLAVLMLGGSVPADALITAVRRVASLAVVLWAQTGDTADLALARRVAGARWGVRGARTQTPVLLCGPGWHQVTDAAEPPGLTYVTSLHDAVRTLTGLRRERPSR
ncbi:MerR family transcriptional regulator [Streptomyces longwoodensis]|uniref:MerR family transcriptional regulator n=1 Tax=Streptomyces longwoodensis TaxID=68231 RepID=UPI003791E2D8